MLGFGTVALVMVVAVVMALLGTGWMSQATRDVLSERVPTTLEILRVARATDSLVSASGPFASVTSEADLKAAFARVETPRQSLHDALGHLDRTSANTEPVRRLTETLGSNLDRIHDLARVRLRLQAEAEAARAHLHENRQAFHRVLTHRMRVLESDGDVLRTLLRRPAPPTATVTALAESTTRLLPVARFYAQMESIHGRLLAASLETDPTALDVAQQELVHVFDAADQTFAHLPPRVVPAVGPAVRDLRALTLSDKGLVALRHRQLAVMSEIGDLMRSNQQISDAVDAATARLTAEGLASIKQAANTADTIRRTVLAGLSAVGGLGLLLVGILMVFYVNRHLIRRLSSLSDAMQAIAAGRFDTPLPATGPDELGRLGAAVHRFHTTAMEASTREINLRAAKVEAETARVNLELKALDLEKANLKLSELSVRDGLTGLFNRRGFDEHLALEWARGRRMGSPLALFILDVDFFKQFNDHYGHQAGDECLRRVAAVLAQTARRAGDLAARYGGEEFCVMLPATDRTAALDLAEAARDALVGLDLPHVRSPFGCVTASFGVAATVPNDALEAADILRAADTALYRAKREGRNRTCVAPRVEG